MRSFQADYVFPVSSGPIRNGIVTVDDSGKIISVSEPYTSAAQLTIQVKKLSGIICPGFVNTHCHLELSHLKGKIEKGKGLVNFIEEVQKHRGADKNEVLDAAQQADVDMYNNGIVAVGDISNTNLSIPIKERSKVYYHTFVEAFGFVPEKAQEVFDKSFSLLEEFKPMPSSITPHAPYSVSKELFKLIKNNSKFGHNLLSIHNQECADENKFFRYKTGSIIDLYEYFGINIDFFKPQARNSLQTMVPLLTNNQRILFVHNTFTNLKDLYFVKRFDRNISFCFCPNANLYIENTIPKINLFFNQGFNLTLGTDSLASNDGLSILEEMKVIQRKVPGISSEILIEWATLNGAKYLGIDHDKGSLEPGKNPGLNLISGLDDWEFTPETKVTPLI
jgi:cytosine/adenosine deaminase-related metal-dependent hydrolase